MQSWWKDSFALIDSNGHAVELEDGPPSDAQLADATELMVKDVEDLAVLPLAKLGQLRSLTVDNHKKVLLGSLAGVERLPALETLEVPGNQLADLTPIATLSELRKLSIVHNKVTRLDPLASLTKLERLYASRNAIRDLGPLANLTKLRVLWIERNRVTTVAPLERCTKLEELQCEGNAKISGLLKLAHLPRLQQLPGYPNEGEVVAFFTPAGGAASGHDRDAYGEALGALQQTYTKLCEGLYSARDGRKTVEIRQALIEKAEAWLADYRKLDDGCSPKQRQKLYTTRDLAIDDLDRLRGFLEGVKASV